MVLHCQLDPLQEILNGLMKWGSKLFTQKKKSELHLSMSEQHVSQ